MLQDLERSIYKRLGLVGEVMMDQISIYDPMRWKKDLDISTCIVAVSSFGGPIAIYQDPLKLLRLPKDDEVFHIEIFSASGELVGVLQRKR